MKRALVAAALLAAGMSVAFGSKMVDVTAPLFDTSTLFPNLFVSTDGGGRIPHLITSSVDSTDGGPVRFNSTVRMQTDLILVGVDAGTTTLRQQGTKGAFTLTVPGANGVIWCAGNDGTGSTLDSDLLDGVEGSNYCRSDEADTVVQLTASTALIAGNMSMSVVTSPDGGTVTINAPENVTGTLTAGNVTTSVIRSADGGTITFPAGNVGIGDTSPAALLTVGNGDKFQVSTAGNMIAGGGTFDGGVSAPSLNVNTKQLWTGTNGAVCLGATATCNYYPEIKYNEAGLIIDRTGGANPFLLFNVSGVGAGRMVGSTTTGFTFMDPSGVTTYANVTSTATKAVNLFGCGTTAQTVTGTDAGTTITPSSCTIHATCPNAVACSGAWSETGAFQGEVVYLKNIGTGNFTFADEAGVFQGATPTVGPGDVLTVMYINSEWTQTAPVSDN